MIEGIVLNENNQLSKSGDQDNPIEDFTEIGLDSVFFIDEATNI